jgi:glucosamine-6-phosphate deaminase
MVYHLGNIVVKVADSMEKFNKSCAQSIMEQLNLKPDSVMGFATGGTPLGAYKELLTYYEKGRVDFKHCTSFNLDEYYPIDKDNPQSYHYYMFENLFGHVNIRPENVFLPNGSAQDPQAECERYECKIKSSGMIDYQILGIGINGHIGFNEPSDKFPGKTHLVDLKQETIDANARFFTSADEVPRRALTMGIKTIMSAKKILFMAAGENKAAIIRETLFGDITPRVPASVLQLHTSVTVLLDTHAASEILPLLEKCGGKKHDK